MGLEETLALIPIPREEESRTVPGSFHAVWCGIASWKPTGSYIHTLGLGSRGVTTNDPNVDYWMLARGTDFLVVVFPVLVSFNRMLIVAHALALRCIYLLPEGQGIRVLVGL